MATVVGNLHARLCPRMMLPFPTELVAHLQTTQKSVLRAVEASSGPAEKVEERARATRMFKEFDGATDQNQRAWLRFARTLRVYLEIMNRITAQHHSQESPDYTAAAARVKMLIHAAHTAIHEEQWHIYNTHKYSMAHLLAPRVFTAFTPTPFGVVADVIPYFGMAQFALTASNIATETQGVGTVRNIHIDRKLDEMYAQIRTAMYVIFNCDDNENAATVYPLLFSLKEGPAGTITVLPYTPPLVTNVNNGALFPPLLRDAMKGRFDYLNRHADAAVRNRVEPPTKDAYIDGARNSLFKADPNRVEERIRVHIANTAQSGDVIQSEPPGEELLMLGSQQ